MEKTPQFFNSYSPTDSEGFKLRKKVELQFTQAKILENLAYKFLYLKTQKGRDDFLTYPKHSTFYKPIRSPSGNLMNPPKLESYHKTKEYKQKKYVLENLYSSDEFKRFLNYTPIENTIEQIVYKINDNMVCAQYINNRLTQISLNQNGFRRDFYKIKKTIVNKYEGKSKTYYVKQSYVANFCGYEIKKLDCFIGVFETEFDKKTKIKVVYYDYDYEKSFFDKPLEEINKRKPSINYHDKGTIEELEKIQAQQNNSYSTSIMKPIYIKLHKLMNESVKIEFSNDLLDQF
tara:strand:+ start:9911 stop:10777 length:867 start_codon:yes stop_codon:yes gene_type:complete